MGVTATADGARLRCGFQKLEGQATPEGLWLESTKPGAAGRLRLVARGGGPRWLWQCGSPSGAAVSRRRRTARSGMRTCRTPTTLGLEAHSLAAQAGCASACSHWYRFGGGQAGPVHASGPDGGILRERGWGAAGLRHRISAPRPSTLNSRPVSGGFAGGAGAERGAGRGGGLRRQAQLEGSGRALAYSRLRVEDATGRELTARLEVLSADRLAVSVADANATYPVRIDPTFSDADWVSLNPGMPGADGSV